MENEPCTKNIENCCLYVYDAKNGKLYTYTDLTIIVANFGSKSRIYTRIKGVDSYRELSNEYDVKYTGSCFSVWFSNPTIENQNKAIDILKKFIKDYAIQKTGKITKEFNRKCGYYRTLIKNSEKLDGNGAIIK